MMQSLSDRSISSAALDLGSGEGDLASTVSRTAWIRQKKRWREYWFNFCQNLPVQKGRKWLWRSTGGNSVGLHDVAQARSAMRYIFQCFPRARKKNSIMKFRTRRSLLNHGTIINEARSNLCDFLGVWTGEAGVHGQFGQVVLQFWRFLLSHIPCATERVGFCIWANKTINNKASAAVPSVTKSRPDDSTTQLRICPGGKPHALISGIHGGRSFFVMPNAAINSSLQIEKAKMKQPIKHKEKNKWPKSSSANQSINRTTNRKTINQSMEQSINQSIVPWTMIPSYQSMIVWLVDEDLIHLSAKLSDKDDLKHWYGSLERNEKFRYSIGVPGKFWEDKPDFSRNAIGKFVGPYSVFRFCGRFVISCS